MIVLGDRADPWLEGTFTMASEQYKIQLEETAQQDGRLPHQAGQMVVYRAPAASFSDHDGSISDQACISPPESSLERRQIGWGERSLTDLIGSTSGCPTSRQIAYIGVATDCNYSATFSSSDAVHRNIINLVNTASVVFENSFNVSLGLRNVTISDAECPDSVSGSTEWNMPCPQGNLSWRLDRFSSWRSSINDDNAFWSLLTGCSGSQGAVGVSWVGQLCNSGASASSSSTGGANVVARSRSEWQVFAHEAAHTFGAVHDCDSSACKADAGDGTQCCPLSSSTCDADGQYLMNPAASGGVTRFSPCTIGNVCSQLGSRRVNTRCLVSARDVKDGGDNGTVVNGSQCGNGVVEPGEACDCGGHVCSDRDARCCDDMTCQWKGGDECARSRAGDGDDDGDDDGGSWVKQHRPLIIGLGAGIGGTLVLTMALMAITFCWQRRELSKAILSQISTNRSLTARQTAPSTDGNPATRTKGAQDPTTVG
ncbi:uncharacterized protein ATNIH1004_011184 [Aspergillus tanneri]|uniref:Peptidase M12B domain-containing protein n=1 Tax=Aspergillus tanneri TaxID=1220188 RepID=A0A5M9MBC8_9EURO|nr:uncharacterized protein ATNIH1004_011184 [Aspergillus tanneri]KAA8642243.1 hypothetical protein ATNIH1004_011184 [Aspergillus tanneri]